MSDPRLKSFFDRLRKNAEERDALAEDAAEIKREAAGAGYDPAVLMRVLAEDRRREKNPEAYAEREELADMYVHAIKGGALPGRSSRIERAQELFGQGKSVRDVAKLMAISKSEAGRLRQLVGERPQVSLSQAGDSGTEDEPADTFDPETGEVLDEPAVETAPAAPVRCAPVAPETPPAPAPLVGDDFPDLPPFLDRRVMGAVQ